MAASTPSFLKLHSDTTLKQHHKALQGNCNFEAVQVADAHAGLSAERAARCKAQDRTVFLQGSASCRQVMSHALYLLASLNVSVVQILTPLWTQHVHLALAIHEHELAGGEGGFALGRGDIKGDSSALRCQQIIISD